MRYKPRKPLRRISAGRLAIVLFLISGLSAFVLPPAIFGQAAQLSLADIIVALRSKKAPLPEKNKILTEAVLSRGTTFTLTPEIEKELSDTGADKALIDSIRARNQPIKIASATMKPGSIPGPETTATPAPLDFSFYENRAEASRAKGELDSALADYTRAIEMNGSDAAALMARAEIYIGRNSFTLAIADLTKVVELNPQNKVALARRGAAYEKKENLELAAADYKKILTIDPVDDAAKASLLRLEPEKPKPADPVATPAPIVTKPNPPEFIVLGQLTEAMAVKSVKPSYPPAAFRAKMGGKVVVEVEIDIEGNVSLAKAVSGNPGLKQNSEEAARHWKFKPSMFGDQPVKAKGFLTFNFVPAM